MRTIDRIRRSGIAVAPDRTVTAVAKIMESSGIGAVAVVEGDDLVGFVTDRDLVRRGIARGLMGDARIDAVMSSPVLAVDADADLAEVIATFGRHTVRRLAVIDAGRFVGVISLDDLLVDAAQQLTALTAPLATEIAAPHRDSPLPAQR